jgi:uncharacterized phiE125 gp8 family phage protein
VIYGFPYPYAVPWWWLGGNPSATAWDRDVRWHVEEVGRPEPTLEVAFVRDQHLKLPSGNDEDAYIERLIRTSERMARRQTRRALAVQTFRITLTGFPEHVRLPYPPLLSVDSVAYVDADGADQTVLAADYAVYAPQGDLAPYGTLEPAYGGAWPAPRAQPNAVVITYQAGYLDQTVSPAEPAIPEDILHGQLLVIGEMYKLRSLSVHAFNQAPAVLQARNLWNAYRVYD